MTPSFFKASTRAFLLSIILFSTSLFFLTSCKKDHGAGIDYGQGTGSCRLSRIIDKYDVYHPDTMIAVYDETNRLIEYNNLYSYGVPSSSKFFYDVNKIYVTTYSGNQISYYDTLTLDGNNRLTRWVRSFSLGQSIVDYSYDPGAGDHVSKLSAIAPGYTLTTHYYTWANGDMVVDSSFDGSNSYVEHNTYFLDRPAQYAMPFSLDAFSMIGRPEYNCAHLLKSRADGNLSFVYTFDSDGKVLTETGTNNNVSRSWALAFQYECL